MIHSNNSAYTKIFNSPSLILQQSFPKRMLTVLCRQDVVAGECLHAISKLYTERPRPTDESPSDGNGERSQPRRSRRLAQQPVEELDDNEGEW